jgi:hypothetical protein
MWQSICRHCVNAYFGYLNYGTNVIPLSYLPHCGRTRDQVAASLPCNASVRIAHSNTLCFSLPTRRVLPHQKQPSKITMTIVKNNKLGSFVAKSRSCDRDPLTLRGPIVARLVEGDDPGSRDRFLSERGKVLLPTSADRSRPSPLLLPRLLPWPLFGLMKAIGRAEQPLPRFLADRRSEAPVRPKTDDPFLPVLIYFANLKPSGTTPVLT